jgi:hypothetical protein
LLPQPKGLGLVVSPGHVPSATELAHLRPAFLRSILYSFRDLAPLLNTGLPILLTINNQMAEMRGWSSAEHVAHEIVRRGRGQVFATNWGNEFDLYWKDNPNDVPPEFAANLVKRVAPILRDEGIAVIPTSVAGPRWPEYLQRLADLCRDDVDFFDLHPYGQRPNGWRNQGWGFGNLSDIIRQASAIAGKPIICSEYGVKLDDAGGPDAVAEFLKAAETTFRQFSPDVFGYASWFAWHDLIGAPSEQGGQAFGLVSADNRTRPAWIAFANLPKAAPIPPIDPPVEEGSIWGDPIAPNAQFALGFKDWADAEPELIGRPHDAREFGVQYGISQQRTTHGLLTFADLRSGTVMTFTDARDGKKYRRDGLTTVEVG